MLSQLGLLRSDLLVGACLLPALRPLLVGDVDRLICPKPEVIGAILLDDSPYLLHGP